jgi:serine/threonine protein phosphatase 1
MAGRTFVVGDVHGELSHLMTLLTRLPGLDAEDTLVFLGDYVDRGPDSRGVVQLLMGLDEQTPAKLVFLRGNHEDGWLRAMSSGWPEFVLPEPNGCWASVRSYRGRPLPEVLPEREDLEALFSGSFFPEAVAKWMGELLHFYEDEHAIYVHAGLPDKEGRFLHPSEVPDKIVLLWLRSSTFFREYKGKRVICGHTATEDLPVELSTYTPEDPADLWFRGDVVAIDTRCGKEGGFLTAIELPALKVYESR